MPSDKPAALPETALRDILHHIDLIERFVAGLDGATFA